MKSSFLHNPAATFALVALAASAQAQTFDSGSTGSYGALVVSNNTTLPLPADGIFHCTTITIVGGATLNFTRNNLNTPVYLLATGDVLVEGTIDVSGGQSTFGAAGQGGPGGFDGGNPTDGIVPASRGLGPGGGLPGDDFGGNDTRAGGGSYGARPSASEGFTDGPIYGNPTLLPLIGGSGGGGNTVGPFRGGSGGGGAVLIASSTRITISGSILSIGRVSIGGYYGAGSGGAIRLVAPVVNGSGTLNVGVENGYGGRGRVRIDTFDRQGALALNIPPAEARTIGANMTVFPNPNPRLSITQVASTNIAEGTSAAVLVNLPFGTPTNQTVQVTARDFLGNVPVRVSVNPEHGPATFFDGTVDNTAVNPATATINVVLPQNVLTRIHVWTR